MMYIDLHDAHIRIDLMSIIGRNKIPWVRFKLPLFTMRYFVSLHHLELRLRHD